jgi:hypothetical protein
MFSALRQGNIVYLLDKSNGLTLKSGQVITNSGANLMYAATPQTVINLTIDVAGEHKEFNNIPAMQSSVNYNNGNLVLIDNKELAITEVENIVSSSKHILENTSYYEKMVTDGEEVLKILNPQFAKDKARDEEIAQLKDKVGGMENKLDTIIGLLGKSENNNKTE